MFPIAIYATAITALRIEFSWIITFFIPQGPIFMYVKEWTGDLDSHHDLRGPNKRITQVVHYPYTGVPSTGSESENLKTFFLLLLVRFFFLTDYTHESGKVAMSSFRVADDYSQRSEGSFRRKLGDRGPLNYSLGWPRGSGLTVGAWGLVKSRWDNYVSLCINIGSV